MKKVSVFYFYSKNGNDHFLISSEPYYTKEFIKGYTCIDKYMFVYYGKKNIGGKYIKTEKLIPYHDTLPGFKTYDNAPKGNYDPFGVIFQIINPDSLILVEKGML